MFFKFEMVVLEVNPFFVFVTFYVESDTNGHEVDGLDCNADEK